MEQSERQYWVVKQQQVANSYFENYSAYQKRRFEAEHLGALALLMATHLTNNDEFAYWQSQFDEVVRLLPKPNNSNSSEERAYLFKWMDLKTKLRIKYKWYCTTDASGVAIGIGIGLCIGSGLGITLKNLATGLALGVGIGAFLGLLMKRFIIAKAIKAGRAY
jgi:hypothetical protein